ncbi:DUF3953 domain-containing protein [Peribacillus sp. SI8-4]|uniref:DUF3953 domain-containing protein n=1 Tax=Peribacillus sp. SI8-4 TaxID=3048009 RepID=UPI0025557D2B|nr:DUF3953 domain-containing protein [Peribacillus sp. SI8-4]
MHVMKYILAVIVVALSLYQLMTGETELMPYMMLCLGAMVLVMGFVDRRRDRKRSWYIFLVISVFLFLVSILGFFG